MSLIDKVYIILWTILMISFIALFIYTIKEIMEEDVKNEK